MLYQALYRKYRPALFDDVYGQEHITSVLRYQAENGRISHAYLFCGSRGTGKTTCAKILAKAINCENPQSGNPCGVCAACRGIDTGTTTDFLEMDAASNNGVDYIRDIRDEVSYTPAMLKRRVYIIDEVHMLSPSAFNALLKTLEEPPEHVVFILATTELHRLPTTIVSRCQRFDFRRISIPVIADRLAFIAKKENIILENAAAQSIAKQAQGGMRDAISLFELCSGGGSDVTLARTQEILGLSGYDFLCDTAKALANGDIPTLLSALSEIANSSKDISVFWQELAAFYRDMMVAKYAENPADYLDLTEQEAKLLNDASAQFHVQTLTHHCSVIDAAMQSMKQMPQMKRVIAEFAFVRMCDPVLDTTPEALSARIGQLEDRLSLMELGVPVKLAPAKSTTEVTAPQTVSLPEEAKTADTSYEDVPDVSEFLEKLSEINRETASFMAAADIAISSDGRMVRITADNPFTSQMLAKPEAKDGILRALVLCRIINGSAEISVCTAKRAAKDDSVAEDLYKNI